MLFIASPILFCFFVSSANSDDSTAAYLFVKSVLAFHRSPSVVLVLEESSADSHTLLTLQKLLSSGDDFHFSSVTTSSEFPSSLMKSCQGLRETVVVWDPTENFPLVLEKISNETAITAQKWLLTTSTVKSGELENLTIPLHTQFTVAYGNPQSGYLLEEIYDVVPGKKCKNFLGRWSVNEFQLETSTDMYKRRGDFRGATITVVSPKRDNCDETSFAVVIGSVVLCFHQKLWDMMAEMLNATTEVQVDPDLNVDTIQQTNADITLRCAHINVVDMNTRDYVWPTFMVRVEVITSYIKQEVEWETFILPFSEQMWTVLLVWIVLLDFILAFVHFVAAGKKTGNSLLSHLSEFSFSTAFTFCSQGVLGPSKLFTARIIFLMMFIVPGVLFPGYSAILTSFLTVQRDKQPFHSIEELSRNTEYKLGWHNTFALEHMFNLKNASPLDKALLENNVLPQTKMPATDAEGVQRICREKFSYLTIMDTILALKPECRYYKLNQPFKLVFASMEMKKNSWYKTFLDRCERAMAFTGIQHRMALQAIMEDVKYNDDLNIEIGEPQPIKLDNMVLPFAVLLLGVIGSTLLLLLEVITFRLKSTASLPIHLNKDKIRVLRNHNHFPLGTIHK